MPALLDTVSSRLRGAASAVAALSLFGATMPAFAMTECTAAPERFFVGDGILYVSWLGGGTGVINQADPDFKPTLAVITAAVLAPKTVVVRYAEDNANCSGATAYNIVGVWLVR